MPETLDTVTYSAVATPVLEKIGEIFVVRDDLIPGGTKRRVLPSYLESIGGGEEFVYASPAYGYAQVALAIACREMGKRATVFTAKRQALHPRTQEAKRRGAKVVLVPAGYLSNVRAKAAAYCETMGATLVPFGLDDERFIGLLAGVAASVPYQPAEVWCTAGSGVLCRALQRAWPTACMNAVRVGKEPEVGLSVRLFTAPETFEQDAKQPPPFPSCSNYDAKAWRFIKQYASPGALFWNVAG